MAYVHNDNVRYCPDCGMVVGADKSWDYHEHDNLACKWLGSTVEFVLCGIKLQGEVVETEQFFLCNGKHDILTVEVWDGKSQVKIQAHRQKFKRI